MLLWRALLPIRHPQTQPVIGRPCRRVGDRPRASLPPGITVSGKLVIRAAKSDAPAKA